ncbi:hypothetical protein AVEN_163630-1 [Araneus ventricosus]|uniref:Tc1-like transposase DDE domain-containing protein n=1 Tax=Araneus ventricosus TaxID=182803 RepID=A0A4Y2IX58_ARAVE|nr:hypothetical protein AVEN_163630-1 [Araneus ventricosus]
MKDSRCNSSSTQAGILMAINGHSPTLPVGNTHYHLRRGIKTIAIPTGEVRTRILIRQLLILVVPSGVVKMRKINVVLPELLQDVLIAIRNRIWFQHDGAPAHFSIDVHNYLNATFRTRWIGRGGPVPWPSRSPDLSSLDYFLWEHLESLIYVTLVDSEEDLVARIFVAAARVHEIPGIFESVLQSLHQHCQACVTVGGRNLNSYCKHCTCQICCQ